MSTEQNGSKEKKTRRNNFIKCNYREWRFIFHLPLWKIANVMRVEFIIIWLTETKSMTP